MKVLSINDAGTYQAVEIPDVKIYKISELANCTIPPMFVLFNHELFYFNRFYYGESINYAEYVGYNSRLSRLRYDFINHKLISCIDSIEQTRQKYHEGTSDSSSGSLPNVPVQ